MAYIENFSVYIGDAWSKTISITDLDKRPINITTDKFYLTIKTSKTVADGAATKQKTFTASGDIALDGQQVINLTTTETNALAAGQYVYDIKWIKVTATPDEAYVLYEGIFEVVDTVTDAVS